VSIQVKAVKQRLLRHRSLTHHRPTLRMLAMSESVDRRYFKAEFFNTIHPEPAVRFKLQAIGHFHSAMEGPALRL
jgi:hypothetical protein